MENLTVQEEEKIKDMQKDNLKHETPTDANNVLGAVYTEKEVVNLLQVQRGNCYVAILTKTKNEDLALVANNAPEPSGGKWRK